MLADLLLLAIGAAAGILIAVLVDGYVLGRSLETAVALNREVAQLHTQAEVDLAEARSEVSVLRRQLAEQRASLQTLSLENRKLEGRLIAAATALQNQRKLARQAQRGREPNEDIRVLGQRIDGLEATLQQQQEKLIATLSERPAIAQPGPQARTLQQARSRTVIEESDSNLHEVRGIGPVYARRLQEAGIVSLADLATQNADRIADVIGLKGDSTRKIEGWLEQARALALAADNPS